MPINPLRGRAKIMTPEREDTPFGICLRWPRTSAQMDLVASTGASIARVGANWWEVERVKGTFDWSSVDAAMAACESRGIHPFILLMGCPEWAWDPGTVGEGDIHGPNTEAQRAGFANFAALAAQRYSSRVIAWEVWNEANGGFWKPRASAPDYAALLKATIPAIRANDRAPIASTGLAGNANLGDDEPLPWMDKMEALGALGISDAFGWHPYTNGNGQVDGMLRMTRDVRQKLDSYGHSWMPILATECGMNTSSRDEAMQATSFDLTVSYLRQMGVPWFCWYQDFDQTDQPGLDVTEQHFGTFLLDGTPKQVVTNMRRHRTQVRLPGLIDARQWVFDGSRLRATNVTMGT